MTGKASDRRCCLKQRYYRQYCIRAPPKRGRYWEIHPRGSREVSRAEAMDFPICHHKQGRIDFNTVNPSLSTGKDFPIHSL